MAIIVGVPRLSRRVGVPAVVGLLLSGIVFGPYGLDVIGTNRPIADFFADLGKLLLMYCAGLEIDLALFRRARNRVIAFGFLTTFIPLLLGTGVGLLFGQRPVAAVVLGSLLASHTLLAGPIVAKLGATRLEPVAVTYGATVVSDTLSLVVFAICVSTFQKGFSAPELALQLIEIAVFIPFILFGLSRLGAYFLRKLTDEEDGYFVVMLLVMTVAAVLAALINLPGIVGAFLAGLAVNAAVHDQPAKEKLKFFGDSLFIPIFFVVTGFLIDPREFYRSIVDNLPLASAVILRAARREVDRGPNRRESFRLLSHCSHDDVVPHAAAGGGDTRSHAGRLQHVQPCRSAPDRWPVAQCGARADADNFHSRTHSYGALCASHAAGSTACEGGLGDRMSRIRDAYQKQMDVGNHRYGSRRRDWAAR